jgi:O-antigen ligase
LRLIGAAALLGAALFAVSHAMRERILVELRPSDSGNTLSLRLPLWQSTLKMLRAHPIFGGGLDGFHRSVQPYKVPGFTEQGVNYPHDLILTFWSETGILGLVAFLWMLAQMARTALAGLRSEPWVRTLSIGLLGVLVAIVVHGLVDVPYFKNDLALEFWALLAIQYGASASVARRDLG